MAPADQPKASETLCCSFCGKGKESVTFFISGPSVYICGGCVALCNEILAENAPTAKPETNVVR